MAKDGFFSNKQLFWLSSTSEKRKRSEKVWFHTVLDFCHSPGHIRERDVTHLSVASIPSLSFKARELKFCIETPNINAKLCRRGLSFRSFYGQLDGWMEGHTTCHFSVLMTTEANIVCKLAAV